MNLSTIEEFPESSLAGEYNRVFRGSSGRSLSGQQHSKNYHDNSDRSQDGIGTPRQQFKQGTDKPAHLAATLIRQPVNIDQPSAKLHYIGRANNGVRWKKRGDNTEETGGEHGDTRRPMQETRWQAPLPQRALPAGRSTTNVSGEGDRDSQGGETTTIKSSGNSRGRDMSVPHQEPAEAHPQQLCPNQAMYTLATTLFRRDPAEWKIEDIKTPFSSDGVAVLNSIFIDHAAINFSGVLNLSQRFRLAQQAAVTAPEEILELIQDSQKARSYIAWALDKDTKIPPVLENSLCPKATPRLIRNEIVRKRMLEGTLLRSEQVDIICAFIEYFYPKSSPGANEFITKVETGILQKYISKAGEIARDIRVKGRRTMTFSPPKWYRLSILPGTKINTTPRRQVLDETPVTWQSLPISRSGGQDGYFTSATNKSQDRIIVSNTGDF